MVVVHEPIVASLGNAAERLGDLAVQVMQIPTITFAAFHPDIVYAFQENRIVKSGLNSDWNSRILMIAYLEGLGQSEAVSLFRADVFDSVGYFDSWSDSATDLAESFSRCDFDFSRWMRAVQRSGVFMYGVNHPVQFALTELAIQISEKMADRTHEQMFELHKLTKDYLAHIVWPVYPEIANRLGLQGSYHWRVDNEYANLPQFVEKCFRRWDESGLRSLQPTFVPSVSQETRAKLIRFVK